MFGSNTINSGLTFGKVLNGISKSLSIANQVIPLYQQAKPMINNAKTIMEVLKGNKNDNISNNKQHAKEKNIPEEIEYPKILKQTNSPTFFQ